MKRLLKILAMTLLYTGVSSVVLAENYRPPVAQFSGEESLSFPNDVSLQFNYGTVEFWVAATWDELEEDSAIISYVGENGPRFALVMSRDKQAIGLLAGDNWEGLTYDFSDGKLHHVAFIFLEDETTVIIDGEFVRSLELGIADLPTHSLNIASLNGVDGRFQGALAGLRIWDAPLDPDDIEAFKLVDITGVKGKRHPYISSLVGITDFTDGRRSFRLAEPALPVFNEKE